MKLKIAVVFLVFSIALAPFALAKSVNQGKDFVGLWQGIDPLDGSEVLRSITLDEDGTFNIIGTETYFDGCDGRGKVSATGSFDNGILGSNNYTLHCYDPEKDITPRWVEYVQDKENGTIVEVIGNFPPVILHRIDTQR